MPVTEKQKEWIAGQNALGADTAKPLKSTMAGAAKLSPASPASLADGLPPLVRLAA